MRSQLVWQVRVKSFHNSDAVPANVAGVQTALFGVLNKPITKPSLRARPVHIPPAPPTPGHVQCPAATTSQYSGLENQLYRVEVHTPGQAMMGEDRSKWATFKWSRDNGAMTYGIKSMTWANNDLHITLRSAGLDDYGKLTVGDWVEYLDETVTLGYNALEPGPTLPLLLVTKVDALDPATVVVSARSADKARFAGKRPFLRRWDQKPAAHAPTPMPRKGTPTQSTVDNAAPDCRARR